MISGYPIWVTILTGAVFVACLGMTLPIYFNLGGELIYPISEAHGQDFSNNSQNHSMTLMPNKLCDMGFIILLMSYKSCDLRNVILDNPN